jgi:gliding motility associated protien GldN
MKHYFIKLSILSFLFIFCIEFSVQAQQRRRTTQSAYGNTNTQTQQRRDTVPATSAYGTTNTATGIDTTLPITVIPSSGNELLDTIPPSLRNDAAIERNLVKDRMPLEYENIREDDAVYRVRVWREIDAREKLNLPFRYGANEDNGNQRFISILLKAIREGEITAFSAKDDRFTTPITPEDAVKALSGGGAAFDTSKKYDLEGNVIGYEVRPKAINPDSIYKFRIKEEWVFDKESSRMFVRILGIAPIIAYQFTNVELNGSNNYFPAFWIYYPDLRPVLAKYEVYNPKNYGARMTWEELFESRMFSSYIVKSTLDNPFDEPFSAYINDPLFRLLEGEKVKEKIFDYEQSLWAY